MQTTLYLHVVLCFPKSITFESDQKLKEVNVLYMTCTHVMKQTIIIKIMFQFGKKVKAVYLKRKKYLTSYFLRCEEYTINKSNCEALTDNSIPYKYLLHTT